MFMPGGRIRKCFLVITLIALAGCAEEGPPLGPDESPSFARGLGRPPVVEEFDFWDESAWIPSIHKKLGHGFFELANISRAGSKLLLTLPKKTTDGAEIRSASRVAYRHVEIIMRTPKVTEPGTISAFFLYQLVPTRNDRNDEIDIEVVNGTQQILLSTYIDAVQTHHWEATLPFDPSDGL